MDSMFYVKGGSICFLKQLLHNKIVYFIIYIESYFIDAMSKNRFYILLYCLNQQKIEVVNYAVEV